MVQEQQPVRGLRDPRAVPRDMREHQRAELPLQGQLGSEAPRQRPKVELLVGAWPQAAAAAAAVRYAAEPVWPERDGPAQVPHHEHGRWPARPQRDPALEGRVAHNAPGKLDRLGARKSRASGSLANHPSRLLLAVGAS